MSTVFHVSDLHFGRPAVPEQFEAIETLIQEHRYQVVAISGDVSQRAREGEFQRARAFIRFSEQFGDVIVVPGNHDVTWWKAPLGIGYELAMYENYRRYIGSDLEPVLRIPGVTFVGVNTAHGVRFKTLTWNLRDIGVIGYVTRAQIARVRTVFEESPDGDARVIVMHHNPVRGELSGRHGLKNTSRILGAFADIGVDVVLCGHDHQEAVHYIEHTRRGTIISTAGTVSNRSRGGRPSSANTIRFTPDEIEVATLVWSDESKTFIPGPAQSFPR
ncbi:MAG TPA: metallophosphoesterase [Gemmatimonadaceae bacterium]|nr:metallophosphoesterase [Gemmatimonadaceae bacterium]